MVDLFENRADSEVCEGEMNAWGGICGNLKWIKKISDSQSVELGGWSGSGQLQQAFVADGDNNEYQMSCKKTRQEKKNFNYVKAVKSNLNIIFSYLFVSKQNEKKNLICI